MVLDLKERVLELAAVWVIVAQEKNLSVVPEGLASAEVGVRVRAEEPKSKKKAENPLLSIKGVGDLLLNKRYHIEIIISIHSVK